MKRLFIRFFDKADDRIPYEVRFLADSTTKKDVISIWVLSYASDTSDWLTTHPDGKVDYIWA